MATMGPVLYTEVALLMSGADLGFCERGAKHSSGSLKQGVWGAQLPRSYRVFNILSAEMMANGYKS